MMGFSVSLLDRSALTFWTAALQVAIFGGGLLIPLILWRRRSDARHTIAMLTLLLAIASPLGAACSLTWGLGWTPRPDWLRLDPDEQLASPREPKRPQPVQARERSLLIEHSSSIPSMERIEGPDQSAPYPLDRLDTPTPQPTVTVANQALEPLTEPPDQVIRSVSTPLGPAPTTRDPKRPVMARPETAANATSQAMSSTAWMALRLGFVAWMLGVLAKGILGLRTRRRLSRLIQKAQPVTDPRASEALRSIAAAQGLEVPPRLLSSESVACPFVIGIRVPTIMIPTSLLAPGTEDMLMHVLAHECAHVARRDLLVGRLQHWVELLWWPHPIVRVHGRILSHAREELCDRRVLRHVAPTEYARTLLSLGEGLSGLQTAPGLSIFSHRHPLTKRIADLLDPRLDRAEALGKVRGSALVVFACVAASLALGIGPPERPKANEVLAEQGPVPSDRKQVETEAVVKAIPLVHALKARASNWIEPPPQLKHLKYNLVLGHEVTSIQATRARPTRSEAWMGTTLHGGFQKLIHSTESFDIQLSQLKEPNMVRISAKWKDPAGSFGVIAGNGVENRWLGYFSHSARSTQILVDTERLVPLEEQTGTTTIRYSRWQEVAPERWVPLQIDVRSDTTHYRMHFSWLSETAWLLSRSESITPKETRLMTRTANVQVNDVAIIEAEQEADRQTRAAAQEVRTMLDHNRPWLDPGKTGAGWRASYQTLSYRFHHLREDVWVDCALDTGGHAAFEVSGDGQGKMGDRLGNRQITLDNQEWASAKRGEAFASIKGRAKDQRERPFDLALKQYARMGCQLDLPLFRYREQLDTASIAMEDGVWNGQACRVATVSNMGPDLALGCGTMLAFSSWSYMHHIRPSREVIFIDPVRKVPLHETLTSASNGEFEIDFGDYVELTPGEWAPRSIRVENRGHFTCEYRFQVVAGTHWMLDEVVSWFDPKDKSRGVVQAVEVNGQAGLLKDALNQVKAARTLFDGEGEPQGRASLNTTPFALGHLMDVGPYAVRVTTPDPRQVAIDVSTRDPNASGTVPLGFLNEQGQLLFAPSISLEPKAEGLRRGSLTMQASHPWRAVRSLIVPGTKTLKERQAVEVDVVPFQWDRSMVVNIPDCLEPNQPSTSFRERPRNGLTRAYHARVDRTKGGESRLTLDLVSIDGTHAFELDLTAALLGAGGELLATGQHSSELRVESEPIQKAFTFPLGPVPPEVEPRWLLIGVSPGAVVAAPMGTLWGSFTVDPPFDAATLLAAPDPSCRQAGLAMLDEARMRRAIFYEFLGDRTASVRRASKDTPTRRTQLEPHAKALTQILSTPDSAHTKAQAIRFLAYSEAEGAFRAIEAMADDPSPLVRDAAAIGLTFLGHDGFLEHLKGILAREEREVPAQATEAERAARSSSLRLEEDTLIALGHQGANPAAIDLLGSTLLHDLESLRPITDAQGGTSLGGRSERARSVTHLLGRVNNPRSVRWLILAIDEVERRPELAKADLLTPLVSSLMAYPEQATDRIRQGLDSSPHPETWIYALSHEVNLSGFIPSARALLLRDGTPVHARRYAARYLMQRENREADDALRQAHDRGVLLEEPRSHLELCRFLATRGDGRGLPDAYSFLLQSEDPLTPLKDEKERNAWEEERSERLRAANQVFDQASPELLEPFLSGKVGVKSAEERLVVLELLWRLLDLPTPFKTVVPHWTNDPNPRVGTAAKRLLNRE